MKRHPLLFKMLMAVAAALLLTLIYKVYKALKVRKATTDNNAKAFLQAIRYAEGTAGANGYRMLFGGKLFSDYSKHPNVAVPFGKTTSTAAGAYQILYRTWLEAAASVGLTDFSPESQDLAALFLIERRGALEDVIAGNFADAIQKCNREWASLPGSPYGQPTKTIAQLTSTYTANGGKIA